MQKTCETDSGLGRLQLTWPRLRWLGGQLQLCKGCKSCYCVLGLVVFHPWACSSVLPSGTSSVNIKSFPELAAENQTSIQQTLMILRKPFWISALSVSMICTAVFLPGYHTVLFKLLFNTIAGKSRPKRLVKLPPQTNKKQETISFHIVAPCGHTTSHWVPDHCVVVAKPLSLDSSYT